MGIDVPCRDDLVEVFIYFDNYPPVTQFDSRVSWEVPRLQTRSRRPTTRTKSSVDVLSGIVMTVTLSGYWLGEIFTWMGDPKDETDPVHLWS